jgi:hypothetical protein
MLSWLTFPRANLGINQLRPTYLTPRSVYWSRRLWTSFPPICGVALRRACSSCSAPAPHRLVSPQPSNVNPRQNSQRTKFRRLPVAAAIVVDAAAWLVANVQLPLPTRTAFLRNLSRSTGTSRLAGSRRASPQCRLMPQPSFTKALPRAASDSSEVRLSLR